MAVSPKCTEFQLRVFTVSGPCAAVIAITKRRRNMIIKSGGIDDGDEGRRAARRFGLSQPEKKNETKGSLGAIVTWRRAFWRGRTR